MELPSSDYNDKVYRFLNNGKTGVTYTVDNLVAKENQQAWIELVKEYMRLVPLAGGWEFNSNYTKLKRFDVNFSSNSKSLFYQ